MRGHHPTVSGLTLGRVAIRTCEETAKKDKKQAEADEGEAEGGQKAHSREQGLQCRRDALGDCVAERGGVSCEVSNHPLAEAQAQPRQHQACQGSGEETHGSLAGTILPILAGFGSLGLIGGLALSHAISLTPWGINEQLQPRKPEPCSSASSC